MINHRFSLSLVALLGCMFWASSSLFVGSASADQYGGGYAYGNTHMAPAPVHTGGAGCGCQHGAGHGHVGHSHSGHSHAGQGCQQCQGGSDLWAGWCNNSCGSNQVQSCDSGCGTRRRGLFGGLRRGGCNLGMSNPFGWDLQAACGQAICGTCRSPRLFGRCRCNWRMSSAVSCRKCNRPRLFGRCGCNQGCASQVWSSCGSTISNLHSNCFDGSFARDCQVGFRRLQRDCSRLFSRRNSCRPRLFGRRAQLSCGSGFSCGNFRMFGQSRCDSGYSGCSSDVHGCVGESHYHGHGDNHYHGHGQIMSDPGTIHHHSPHGTPVPMSDEPMLPQPIQTQPQFDSPMIENNLPVNPQPGVTPQLPVPGTDDPPATALHGPFGRPISFEVPNVKLPRFEQLFD